MSSPDRHEILLVEDNPGDARLILEMLNDELGEHSFSMKLATTVDRALATLESHRFGVILLDLSLPDSFGLETFQRIQAVCPAVPIIVLTGNQDQALALAAVKEGAQDFLVKNGLTGGLLLKAIQYANERKRIEASLRVSEARFRSLTNLSSDWYWEQDDAGRITFVSGGLLEKSGIDPGVFLGRCWWDVPGFAPQAGWDAHQAAIDRREPFKDLVVRYQPEHGDPIYISISGSPLVDEAGVFSGYRGVGKDVTARERVEADLRGSEQRYRTMMDTARDGILMTSDDGLITFANLRALEMLGLDERAVRGKPMDAFVDTSGTDIETQSPAPAAGQTAGGPIDAVRFRREGGQPFWAMLARYPVQGRDGMDAGALTILTDLTEFQQREERIRQLAALAAQKSEAERAYHAKSRFLAAVSHDLRQPMHALGLFIDDLKGANLPPTTLDLIGNMESALDLTNSLLDSLLVMSRLESGLLVPNVVTFPIQPLLTRIQRTFRTVASARSLELRIVPSDRIVVSDPALLERMIANLVSNALRYTDQGGVLLGCRARGTQIRIEVWDSGLGIPAEHMESIFREFFRVESDSAGRNGLGLGLSIVQGAARLLGHEVGVTSTRGRGSRFSIAVAQGMAAAARPDVAQSGSEDEAPAETFDGLRVLVVDDDPAILASTCALLQRWGCEVMSAPSLEKAISAAGAAAKAPQLIVSDLRLSGGETGIRTIAAVRQQLGAPTLPALILTGDTSLQTSREIKSAGLQFLYKPVPQNRLRILMRQLLGMEQFPG